jgi:hypothetical protein
MGHHPPSRVAGHGIKVAWEPAPFVLAQLRPQQMMSILNFDGFLPFGHEGIPFLHSHPGILLSNGWPSPATPHDKVQEMFLA